MEKLVFTVPEVAAALHCSVKTVRGLIRTGKLQAVRPAHSYLISRANLQNYIDGKGAQDAQDAQTGPEI